MKTPWTKGRLLSWLAGLALTSSLLVAGCSPTTTTTADADSGEASSSSLPPSSGQAGGSLPPSGPTTGNAGGVTMPSNVTPQPNPNQGSGYPNTPRPAQPKFVASGRTGFEIGDTAPDIDGADLSDVGFKLSDYRGKVVVLDFWGDW